MKQYCLIVCLLLLVMVLSCDDTGGEAERLYVLALSAYGNEELQEALELTQAALQVDKNFYQADFLRAKILFFQGSYEQSLLLLEKLIKTYPEFSDARIWRVRTLILLQNYKKAEVHLDQELSFNQSDWRLYYLYSILGLHTKNYGLQLAMLKRAELCLKDGEKVFMDVAHMYSYFESIPDDGG